MEVQNNKGLIIDYIPKKRGGKVYAFFKRLFDICASFLGLVVLSPVLLIIFIAAVIATGGHGTYIDKRIGKNGKEIGVLKFRTMIKGANEHPEAYLNLEQQREYEEERRVEDDPRVTKFGKFLRKTAIDELPQLFNILIGQMSFVGPRAVTMGEVEKNFSPEQAKLLLSVRPGLTSSWRAYGKHSAYYTNGGRQRLELEYLERRSFSRDLKIIFSTFSSVLTDKDAKRR
ncbi:MAG: sugar transferase [Clostridiales bacterium]|nr:sugar transferase [Clostridiales bacterium]